MSFFNWLTSVFLSISLFFSSVFGFFSGVQRKTEDPPEQPAEVRTEQIRGVCHPNEDYTLIKDLGLGWVRFDIPYPYQADGSLSEKYIAFKNRARGYAQQGIKVLAITPYPKYYFNVGGFDPSADENAERTKEIARFLCSDLRDVVGGLQITNEMGVASFTAPLTLEQAAKFIGVQAQALSEVKGDLPVGYNAAGVGERLHRLMQPYLPCMDYVGVDYYAGTLSDGGLDDYASVIERVHGLTGKPVLLAEFGFSSAGEPKSAEEHAEILAQYGYASPEAARDDIENFVAKLPNTMKAYIYSQYPDPAAWGDAVFGDLAAHFYGELDHTLPGIPHTPRGQAEFYHQLLPRLKQIDCLAGFFIFCWQDGGACKLCGKTDCPYKSAWGITDINGEPKPAYYAVREALAA